MPAGATTFTLLLNRALGAPCGQASVDWAVGMLSAGNAGRHLAMLAGMSLPFNHFELKELENQALRELSVEDLPLGVAIGRYAAELLSASLANRSELLSALRELYDITIGSEHRQEAFDFYLLHLAYEDLLKSEHQWYWEGADRANIWEIIYDRARCHIEQWGEDI